MPTLSVQQRLAVVECIPLEHREAAYEVLAEVLPGWSPADDPDPLIDAPMFAHLAGVAPNTPGAWQQRTREGKERVAFPAPGEPRYRDKPQWYAISQALGYLIASDRWPRGVAARESTRAGVGRGRLTFADVATLDRELAAALAALGANDERARTIQGWRSLRTRRASAASS